ncbi:MAG TPA: dihydrolipoamide acetyltransferase family protein [Allosphingosinicella sp.]|nr:dihydrolipoamide acetyltransferase family protein [Allosphingosinicella sp.]
MARYQFKLPDIGEGIAEAEIVAWHVKVGDMVREDQQLADMMTDKATVEMESPVAGKVVALAGEVGDQIPIGSVLVEFEVEGEASAAPKEEERSDTVALADGLVEPTPQIEEAVPSTAEEAPLSSPARPEPVEGPSFSSGKNEGQGFDKLSPSGGSGEKHVLASPAVRQRARDLGIDLAQVKTAGDRIRHSDLDAYLLYNGASPSRSGAARRRDEQIKVVGLRRKIAENMQEAKRRIPHFTLVEEYDVTALEQTRAMMNADRGSNPKLTMLPFLITAMARTLADYPQINATYDDEAQVITRSGAVHMGIATQTPNGLMVPVIRDAGSRDIWSLAGEILRLAEAARAGKAAREELSGSTITLSSLGPMGGITSTPVINRPEVAIVAVNKVEEKPVVFEGELEIRKRMNLSLSCDHRVVDGWDAAMFMQDLKKLIENPLKLLSTR